MMVKSITPNSTRIAWKNRRMMKPIVALTLPGRPAQPSGVGERLAIETAPGLYPRLDDLTKRPTARRPPGSGWTLPGGASSYRFGSPIRVRTRTGLAQPLKYQYSGVRLISALIGVTPPRFV